MKNVAILGSTGMLGSALAKVLTPVFGSVIEVNRAGTPVIASNRCLSLDVEQKIDLNEVFAGQKIDYVVNAIGMIKQVIDASDISDLTKAQAINCDFVSQLNEYSDSREVPVIQIGTDCVFSGSRGNYLETDRFETTDVYSKSKIAGEKNSPSSMILRTSIVGREIKSSHSLLEWILSQKKNSEIKGFTNHFWNGVTSFHFAKLVTGIIESDGFTPGTFHVVPSSSVSKYELLNFIIENFQRPDLKITKFEAPMATDRTLGTVNPAFNRQIWAQAGYDTIPDVEEMVVEYANWLGKTQFLY
ncbi:RfbD dTDP-4-dehydrorhamnose reductase [Candidatus Nanopelagicaceae bacterium]